MGARIGVRTRTNHLATHYIIYRDSKHVAGGEGAGGNEKDCFSKNALCCQNEITFPILLTFCFPYRRCLPTKNTLWMIFFPKNQSLDKKIGDFFRILFVSS